MYRVRYPGRVTEQRSGEEGDRRPAPAETPATAPAMRASDADRDRVAEILREALAEGRLDAEEHAERIDAVYRARTRAELEPLVRDLPVGQPFGTPPPAPAGATPSGATRNVVAVLGGAERRGRWRVSGRVNVVAFLGGVELDLTQAFFDQRVVTLNVTAVLGGVEIKVPGNVTVRGSGTGILGGFSMGGHESSDPNAPVLVIQGLALLGGVEVKRVSGEQVHDLRAPDRD
ncbi:DUF1707 domain-containing protein [Streptomyces alkaliphilus]|uniref:DUF1707 domain-containing protein n=1 Tax=Streptomyces alkaliphilus TaxID=1472722 RepID=A0A7W3TDK5_9ACTN|nr:DUF1707 domain-containing protein [Streptomyces alkaliphilus]